MFIILSEKPESCRSTNRRFPTLSLVTFLIEYSKLFFIITATPRELALDPWIMHLQVGSRVSSSFWSDSIKWVSCKQSTLILFRSFNKKLQTSCHYFLSLIPRTFADDSLILLSIIYITGPHELNNTEVTNHFSACQYPCQVQEYIEKDIKLGALLGQFTGIDHK